ncbi:HNH endonuclease [bacterium]|nr:HNH endonuclease [bacterium]
MKYKLEPYHRNVPDEDLISDLIEVKEKLGKDKITREEYNNFGKYSAGTMGRKFGTWNKALQKAGIELSNKWDISEEELFKNIEEVWIKLGRQPRYSEFKQPLSKYSSKPYERKYGSWLKALQKFVDFINSESEDNEFDDLVEVQQEENLKEVIKHKTKRNISDRLRFRILMRDGFTCKSCGRSPVKERGVELHVDHILPWSKGGETVPENLETKCKKCNLGKGNAFNV